MGARWHVSNPLLLGAALAAMLSPAATAFGQEAPPPPLAGEAPPPASVAAPELRVVFAQPAGPEMLQAGTDCAAHAQRGQYAEAALCAAEAIAQGADAPMLALRARALEALGLFDEAGAQWQTFARKTRGQDNLEATRRLNELAALEEVIAATAAGGARKTLRRLDSIRQTFARQAGLPGGRGAAVPAAFELQRGWTLLAARQKKPAAQAFAAAATGTGRMAGLAALHKRRLGARKAARGPWPMWTRTLGATGKDSAGALAMLPGGDLLVAGSLQVQGEEAEQLQLWRTDQTGRQRWGQAFGSTGRDGASAIAALSDGGAVLAGETAGDDGQPDLFAVRFGADRNLRWHTTLPQAGPDRAAGVVCAPQGGCLVVGNMGADDGAHVASWTISPSGERGALERIAGPGRTVAHGLASLPTGLVIAGQGPSEGAKAPVAQLWWLDAAHRPAGSWKLDSAPDSVLSALAPAPKGALIAVGSAPKSKGEGRALLLVQLDKRRKPKWTRRWDDLQAPNPVAVVDLGRKGSAVLLTGRDTLLGATAWVLGVDGRGKVRWQCPVSADVDDVPTAMIRGGRGALILAGQTLRGGLGAGDGWLMQVDN